MAEMGKYCKAYQAKDFRKYSNWKEDVANLHKETEYKDGQEVEIPREELLDDDVLYLQENYVVTDGIMKDENIIFDDVTDEWKKYCHEDLEFEIPEYEPIEIKPAESSEGEGEEAASH